MYVGTEAYRQKFHSLRTVIHKELPGNNPAEPSRGSSSPISEKNTAASREESIKEKKKETVTDMEIDETSETPATTEASDRKEPRAEAQ